jgi:hypothetical protein
MEMVLTNGKMDPNMKDLIMKGKNKEMEVFIILRAKNTLAIGIMANNKAMAKLSQNKVPSKKMDYGKMVNLTSPL